LNIQLACRANRLPWDPRSGRRYFFFAALRIPSDNAEKYLNINFAQSGSVLRITAHKCRRRPILSNSHSSTTNYIYRLVLWPLLNYLCGAVVFINNPWLLRLTEISLSWFYRGAEIN
jgi:hypothetical protein